MANCRAPVARGNNSPTECHTGGGGGLLPLLSRALDCSNPPPSWWCCDGTGGAPAPEDSWGPFWGWTFLSFTFRVHSVSKKYGCNAKNGPKSIQSHEQGSAHWMPKKSLPEWRL